MKMFLLRTINTTCPQCGTAAMVIIRAADEMEARKIAYRSNTHGIEVTKINWMMVDEATCNELPLLDGPGGIVVGSWLKQHLPG
jgi:hypothetical protein